MKHFLILVVLLLPCSSFAQTKFCVDVFRVSYATSFPEKKIKEMIINGKNVVRSGRHAVDEMIFFKKIVSLTNKDLQSLKTSQLISLYSLFANWNLLPPKKFQYNLLSELAFRIDTWREADYRGFSIARKLSPMPLTKKFEIRYQRNLLKNFSQFGVKTQLELLGAELLHQTYFKSRDLHFLLEKATTTLAATPENLPIKILKELYRSLLFLRTNEPTLFFDPLVRLEVELEKQMNQQGLSFNTDGRSGDDRARFASKGYLRFQFEKKLDELFDREIKHEEYSDPKVAGFYDPVDIYFPTQRLIVEWDGIFHYFQYLKSDGSVESKREGLILRPLDQAKDKVLRRNGYRILRVSPLHNQFIHTAEDIRLLIDQQNSLPFSR